MTELSALIIDDVPEVVQLCQDILATEGFRTWGMYRAADALAWLREHHVDLIVTDIHMPDMDGLTMLRQLRERDPEIPVIIITGFGTMENAVQALRLGAQDFVLKPFMPEELLEVVRNVLEKQRVRCEAMRLRAWLPLLAMNQILVTETDLRRLGEQTVDLVIREGQADLAVLLLKDLTSNVLTVQAARGLPARAAQEIRIPVGQGLIGQLAQPGARTSILADGTALPWSSLVPLQAALLVALRVASTPIGVLVIGKSLARPLFQANDIEFFTLLGSQVATALENVRLFEAARKRAEQLAALNDISRAIISVLDLDTVLQMVMQAIKSTIQVEEATLFLIDEQTQELEFSITFNYQKTRMPFRLAMGQGVAGWVAQHQQAVIVNDVRQDQRFYAAIDEQTGFETRSILCVPLRGREGVIGVLEVLNKLDGPFTDQDLSLLESMAAPMTIAVENARLFERLRAANQELFAAKELTERILENIPSGVLAVDPAERILMFNQAARRLTGYSEVELVGKPVTDILRPPVGQPSPFSEALRHGASSLCQGAVVMRRDGTLIPVEVRASAFRDEASQIVGAVGVLLDLRQGQVGEGPA